MKKAVKKMVPMVFLVFVMVGCGGSSTYEIKPIAEVTKEAEGMSVDKLKQKVSMYKKMLADRKGEIAKVKAKLKEIPLKELLGDDAKVIKAEISEITISVKALTERLNIYAKQLKSVQ